MTLPNWISLFRILLIPVFVLLLLHRGRAYEEAGLLLLGAVVATDWVDGYVARRMNSSLARPLEMTSRAIALDRAMSVPTLRPSHASAHWADVVRLGSMT